MNLVTRLIDDHRAYVNLQKTFPDWMWDLLGESRMQGLEPIESIRLYETPVTALEFVSKTNVQELHALKCRVSDSSVVLISEMESLQRLGLSPAVGDRHYPANFPDTLAQAVSGLPNLELIRLRNFELSPEVLNHFSSSRSLREITFLECRVAGVKQLAELKSLRALSIDTLSDGPGLLNEISKLTQLTELDVDLFALKVNDEELQVLSHLRGLKSLGLNLMYTDVTQDGIDKLKKALPTCHIDAAIGEG
jgi:hypothetical protein